MDVLGMVSLFVLFVVLAVAAGQVDRPLDKRKIRDRIARGGFPTESWEV